MYVDSVKMNSVLNKSKNQNRKTVTTPSVNFTAQDNTNEQEKKGGFSFKKFTNGVGVVTWLSLVATGIIATKMFQKNSPEQLKKNAEKAKTLAKGSLEEIESKGKSNTENKSFAYKLANTFANWTNSLGEELYNNYLYAFGTLVIMPIVVLLSPSKNKKKETEPQQDVNNTENNAANKPKVSFGTKVKNFLRTDKFFTIIRQPFSVGATLGLQLTFDSLLKKRIPEVIGRNSLEDSKWLKDGKFISIVEGKPVLADGVKLTDLLSNIKYNTDEAETVLKELTKIEPKDGGLKGIITEDELKEILDKEKLKSYEKKERKTLSKKFADFIYKKYSIDPESIPEADRFEKKVFGLVKADKDAFSILTSENVSKTLTPDAQKASKIFKDFLDVYTRKDMITQRTKVGANVLFSCIIGYTFLNVIYGKSLKAMQKRLNKDDQKIKNSKPLNSNQDNKMKEVA